jgi:lysophospholipase L1-like esterase
VPTLAGLLTIDGVALAAKDRVLLTAQTNSKDNGIYTVAAGAWARADDMAKASFAMLGTTVRVMEGTTAGATIWTMTAPTNGSVRVGVDALTFEIEFGVLQGVADWTPASIPGVYFWAKGITDSTLRTMTGNRIDLMQNGIAGGVSITRSAGTPIIDTTKVRNGYNPMVMDSTTNLGAASGGPVGNAPHCIIILTDGSDATAFTGFVRAGAVGGSGGLGLTTSGRYAAGLVAGEGTPNVASPEPLADGALRMLHCQHRPNYGLLTVGIDGHAPVAASGSSWAYTKTLALDGTFAFSNIEAGRTPNASPIWDAVLVSQEVSAGDLARLAAYWETKFSLPELAPRLLFLGDSLTDPTPISPATTTWPAVMTTTLNAQLTIDGRTNVDTGNTALSGKMLNGLVWAAGSPNISRQADGVYQTAVLTGIQGLHNSAPYSRSGRREYEIIMGVAGTNDIINAARTGAQIIEDLKYVLTQLRAQGYYRIWGTIPPGSTAGGYFNGSKETYRVEVNDWLVDEAYGAGYLDEPAVDFEAAGLAWNVTYYGAGPDTLHQNDAGKALMAAAMYEAVYSLIRRIDP